MNTTAGSSTVSAVQCRHCGNYHGPLCPSVRAIEYYPDGTIKRIEFTQFGDLLPRSQPQPWWPPTTCGGTVKTGSAVPIYAAGYTPQSYNS